jgi:glycosyltransferase involved in cell wall biosynthesis
MPQMMRPRPSILHLFSEWKWTGAAESIVNLVRHLRRHGHQVDLACARPPGNYPESLEHRARERRVEPVLEFQLKTGVDAFLNRADIQEVAEFIDREEVQVIHTHTTSDHYVGSRAARRANNQPFVVRTNHTGVPLRPTLLNRWLIGGHTDAWVALSPSCRDADAASFRFKPAHAVAVEGAVDLERFSPSAVRSNVRPEIGFGQEHVVAGAVASSPEDRRWGMVLPALVRAMNQEPSLRAILLGRGPVETPEGMAGKAFLPGYRSEDYSDYLAAIDFLVYPGPGSDGSCPGAREAMALGKPVIAPRQGILPELVEDGRCGLAVDVGEEDLVQAILRLARDPALRQKLGRAAAAKAKDKFDIERQVEAIGELYLRLAEGR